jgi:hypothetical protein
MILSETTLTYPHQNAESYQEGFCSSLPDHQAKPDDYPLLLNAITTKQIDAQTTKAIVQFAENKKKLGTKEAGRLLAATMAKLTKEQRRQLAATDWDTTDEGIDWLWQDKIPLGTCSLIAGEGGLSKSTVAISLACAISTRGDFPDGTTAPLGDTLIFSAEDPSGIVKKRIRQHGGNFAKIHKIEGTQELGKTVYFDIGDIATLETALHRWPETKLIIIDPVASYVSGIDSHKNADVRSVMAPLADFAERHNLTVLLIIHLNKDEKKSVSNRISGSGAWRDLARSVWFVAKDKNAPDLRYLMNDKQNYAPLSEGYQYSVAGGVVVWQGATQMKLADLMGTETTSKGASATEWLRGVLRDGEKLASEIYTLAETSNVSDYALRGARNALNIIPRRNGFSGSWVWGLPGTPVTIAPDKLKEDDPFTN